MLAGTHPRVLQGASTTLSYSPRGADGEPAATDPGVVTIGVTRADGTTVVTAGTATTGTGVNPRTYALTAANTAYLDTLTYQWSVGSTVVGSGAVEVVGDYYFTSAEVRTGEPTTSDPTKDTAARLLQSRSEVEAIFESACGVAFVPRFSVDQLTNPCGEPVPLTWARIRTVRWVRAWAGSTSVDYTAEQLSYIRTDSRRITLPTYLGGTLIEIGYEHGYDSPPFDVKREAIVAARAQTNKARPGVPDRATSMQMDGGGTITLATPGVGNWHFGIPSVDEVLRRYDHRCYLT